MSSTSAPLVGTGLFSHPEEIDLRRDAAAAPLPWWPATSIVAALSLLLADAAVFGVSFSLASGLRSALLGPMPQLAVVWLAGIGWLAARLGAGLYPGYGLAPPEELRTAVVTTLAIAGAQTAMLFVMKETAVSRLVTVVTWVVVMLASVAVRAVVKRCLISRGLYGCPVVVVGAGETAAHAVREMKENRGIGYVPVALFDDEAPGNETVEDVPVLGSLHAAAVARFPYPISHAVIAIADRGPRLAQVARLLSRRYRNVGVVHDLLGVADLWLRPRAIGTCLTLEVRNNLLVPFNRVVKRCADLVLAVPLLALSCPLIVAAGLAVKLISPGPLFFAQDREGLHGRRIRVWKLRTMVADAEARLEAYLAGDRDARADWETRMKLRRDPRIVPWVGRFLRKFSIDELPQLWNVVKGEMSLVGPARSPTTTWTGSRRTSGSSGRRCRRGSPECGR